MAAKHERSFEMSRRSTTESTDASPFMGEDVARKVPAVTSYGPTESHQFDIHESEVWWHHQLQRCAHCPRSFVRLQHC
jgi:hypothetical protein